MVRLTASTSAEGQPHQAERGEDECAGLGQGLERSVDSILGLQIVTHALQIAIRQDRLEDEDLRNIASEVGTAAEEITRGARVDCNIRRAGYAWQRVGSILEHQCVALRSARGKLGDEDRGRAGSGVSVADGDIAISCG